MGEQGHTPGPWTSDPDQWDLDFYDDWSVEFGEGATWKIIAAKGEDCPIAIVTGRYDAPHGDERVDCNARLICAIPDMLAELQRLSEKYGHQQTADVIARATGRAALRAATKERT